MEQMGLTKEQRDIMHRELDISDGMSITQAKIGRASCRERV